MIIILDQKFHGKSWPPYGVGLEALTMANLIAITDYDNWSFRVVKDRHNYDFYEDFTDDLDHFGTFLNQWWSAETARRRGDTCKYGNV